MAAEGNRVHRIVEADVAIVGCGPVGAMLANLLGLQGVTTAVFEREPTVYPQPRAVHFDDEVMRILQTVDLAAEMEPLLLVSPGMLFLDESERLLLDWSRPQERGAQGWHASYRFHQPDLERILRKGLSRFPCVAVNLSSDVFAIDVDDDGAIVRFEDVTTGALSACSVRYVVGCDGARSLVRRLIGEPMEDLGFHEKWLVIDAILKRPRPDLGNYSIQYCDAVRPATYVRGTGSRRRWEIAILPNEDGAALARPENVFDLLKRWVGPQDVSLERAVPYTFHAASARRWRSGPLAIAGDAAHLTPPFLGQGMCAGMRDVANLAWKLCRVLRGLSHPALLDTYQAERGPHVREYIDLAVRLGGLINTKAKDAAMSGAAITSGAVSRMASIKPKLGPGLSAEFDDPAGRIAPQPLLEDGTRLDDAVGYRYVALMQPDFAAAVPREAFQRLTRQDVVVMSAPAPESQTWLRETGAGAVIVRPDRYVLGAARSIPEFAALTAVI